jgi:thymidylate synthase
MVDFIKEKYGKEIEDIERSNIPVKALRISRVDWKFMRIVLRILCDGVLDKNPRPHYEDGTPAHTISVNHEMATFDLEKNEFPIISLRPIPFKSAIGELLWIYQDQSNSLDLLKDKYGISWWDNWDIGDRTIGACYGETVRRHDLMNRLLEGLEKDPDSRRHIISLWQEDDFKDPHGLKPCAFLTNWNVRHEEDGDRLDMCLYQRSADFAVGVMSNWVQYATFLVLVASCLDLIPGKFTWFCDNVQIYDRHVDQCMEMLRRKSIYHKPFIRINNFDYDFYNIKRDDIILADYPLEEIKEKNPQIKFPIGI